MERVLLQDAFDLVSAEQLRGLSPHFRRIHSGAGLAHYAGRCIVYEIIVRARGRPVQNVLYSPKIGTPLNHVLLNLPKALLNQAIHLSHLGLNRFPRRLVRPQGRQRLLSLLHLGAELRLLHGAARGLSDPCQGAHDSAYLLPHLLTNEHRLYGLPCREVDVLRRADELLRSRRTVHGVGDLPQVRDRLREPTGLGRPRHGLARGCCRGSQWTGVRKHHGAHQRPELSGEMVVQCRSESFSLCVAPEGRRQEHRQRKGYGVEVVPVVRRDVDDARVGLTNEVVRGLVLIREQPRVRFRSGQRPYESGGWHGDRGLPYAANYTLGGLHQRRGVRVRGPLDTLIDVVGEDLELHRHLLLGAEHFQGPAEESGSDHQPRQSSPCSRRVGVCLVDERGAYRQRVERTSLESLQHRRLPLREVLLLDVLRASIQEHVRHRDRFDAFDVLPGLPCGRGFDLCERLLRHPRALNLGVLRAVGPFQVLHVCRVELRERGGGVKLLIRRVIHHGADLYHLLHVRPELHALQKFYVDVALPILCVGPLPELHSSLILQDVAHLGLDARLLRRVPDLIEVTVDASVRTADRPPDPARDIFPLQALVRAPAQQLRGHRHEQVRPAPGPALLLDSLVGDVERQPGLLLDGALVRSEVLARPLRGCGGFRLLHQGLQRGCRCLGPRLGPYQSRSGRSRREGRRRQGSGLPPREAERPSSVPSWGPALVELRLLPLRCQRVVCRCTLLHERPGGELLPLVLLSEILHQKRLEVLALRGRAHALLEQILQRGGRRLLRSGRHVRHLYAGA